MYGGAMGAQFSRVFDPTGLDDGALAPHAEPGTLAPFRSRESVCVDGLPAAAMGY